MDIKNHFLNLVISKGGFKPLHAHFDKSNVVTADIIMQAQKESMQDMFSLMSEIKQKLNSENELACMSAIIKLFEQQH